MKAKFKHHIMAALLGVVLTAELHAQTTAFTYQGQLTDNGSPASGTYDLRFAIYNVAGGGSAVGGPITNSAVAVSNGLFAVTLDFGSAAFDGTERWLEVAARPNGSGAFTLLSPRQQITSTPYALKSLEAAGVSEGAITAAMLAPGAVSMLGTPNGSNPDVVQVNNDGLVGIGTTDPVAGLHIDSTGSILTASVLFQVRDGTDSFTNLAGANGLAYSGGLLAVAATTDDAVTFLNVNNPAAPVVLSQVYDGNGSFTNLGGAYAVAFSGSLVAVAGRDDDTVTIIDVSTPTAPVRRGEIRDGVGGFNEVDDPVSVAFVGNLLAISSDLDHAVTLVNVSNPDSPALQVVIKDGTFGFNALEQAFQVALQGNLLAIAAVADNSVTLVDVTTPSNPQLRAVLTDGVGGIEELGGAAGVEFFGNTLAVSALFDNAVTLFDVSNPASPVQRAVLKRGQNGVGSLYAPFDLSVSGDLLAVVSLLDSAVTLFNVSDPSNPRMQGVFHQGQGGIHYMNSPLGVAFIGDNLVAAGRNSSGLTFLDPVPAGVSMVTEDRVGIGTLAPAATLHVAGDLLVVGNETGLRSTHVGLGLGVATGDYSTAMGNLTEASGGNSTAMGFETTADGQDSTAMGSQTSASGDYSTAMGSGSVAAGAYSTAIGNHTSANALSSLALGHGSEANNNFAIAAGRRAMANHSGSFVWADGQDADFTSTAANQASFRTQGGVRFTSGSGGGNQTVSWLPGNASWSFSSDRNLKEGLQPVDANDVLDRVSRLPLHEWNYIGYEKRHLGPMAQDFHEAFPWSGDERSLNSADLDGVALAAIQGLNEKLEQRLEQKETEITELRQAMNELKELVQIMNHKLNGGKR